MKRYSLFDLLEKRMSEIEPTYETKITRTMTNIESFYSKMFRIKDKWDNGNGICKCGHSKSEHRSICWSMSCYCIGFRIGNLSKLTDGMYKGSTIRRLLYFW